MCACDAYMNDSRISVKKLAIVCGKVAIVTIATLGAMVACVFYANWSADRKAKAFCDAINVGSDISLTIDKAKKNKIFFGNFQGFTFYFPGTGFDKAVCEVSVDPNGKVTSKNSEMEYD